MTKELPARANLEHLKSQAKDLLDAFQRRDPKALERFRTHLPSVRGRTDAELAAASFALHDAQSVIAREYGFTSYGELKAEVERRVLSPEALRELMERNRNEPLPQAVLDAVRSVAAASANAPSGEPITPGAVLPVVAVRNAVVTVGSVAPLGIGRPASVAAVRAAEGAGGILALFTQRDEANETPTDAELHPVGCAARVLKTLAVPERGFWIVVRATAWITLEALERTPSYVSARVRPFEVTHAATEEVATREARLRELVTAYVGSLPEATALLRMIERMGPLELADATVANLPASVDEKARYAAEPDLALRLQQALVLLEASS